MRISAFNKAWDEKTLEFSIPSKPITLGEVGNPMQGSYPESVPNASSIGFYPGKTTIEIQTSERCENFRMPSNAPGIYVITKTREWEKIEVKMPAKANDYVQICSQAGYDVVVVFWAMKGEE